jgi:hypothetical protein
MKVLGRDLNRNLFFDAKNVCHCLPNPCSRQAEQFSYGSPPAAGEGDNTETVNIKTPNTNPDTYPPTGRFTFITFPLARYILAQNR